MRRAPPLEKSPLLQRMLSDFNAGEKVHKHDAAERYKCAHRTAQYYLSALHDDGLIRVASWKRLPGGAIPVYKKADGRKDVKKPAPYTMAERARRWRARNDDIVKNRTKSLAVAQKALAGKIKLGVWYL
jgi:hypothetical protein